VYIAQAVLNKTINSDWLNKCRCFLTLIYLFMNVHMHSVKKSFKSITLSIFGTLQEWDWYKSCESYVQWQRVLSRLHRIWPFKTMRARTKLKNVSFKVIHEHPGLKCWRCFLSAMWRQPVQNSTNGYVVWNWSKNRIDIADRKNIVSKHIIRLSYPLDRQIRWANACMRLCT